MSSNRPSRNPQQMRSLIQNMGRSIDEARLRRLGPTLGTPNASQSPAESRSTPRALGLDTRIGTDTTSSAPASKSTGGPSSPPSPPPVRAANEMFVEGGQRLKARPKRPA